MTCYAPVNHTHDGEVAAGEGSPPMCTVAREMWRSGGGVFLGWTDQQRQAWAAAAIEREKTGQPVERAAAILVGRRA